VSSPTPITATADPPRPPAPLRTWRQIRRRARKLVSGPLGQAANWLIPVLHRCYIDFVWHTSRVEYHGLNLMLEGVEREGNIILACWHETAFFAPRPMMPLNPASLVSASDTGDVYAGVMRRCNFELIRGGSSSSRSRRKPVMDQMIRYLSERRNVVFCIATDGSSGPLHVLKPGAVALMRESGAPLFCGHVDGRPMLRLPTWDRMQIPLPFSRILITFDGPIAPEDGTSYRALRRKAQELLENVTRRTREAIRSGRAPAQGAPVDPSYPPADLRPGTRMFEPGKPMPPRQHLRPSPPPT